MRLTLYIARHGETDWNRDRRIQGSTDVPLNATGLAQAAALAERLLHVPFVHVYVSALRRALQTAAALPSHLPRTILPELNERRMGGFEGVSFLTAPPATLEAYRARKFAPHDDMDGGESLMTHRDRARRALDHILSTHRGGDVLVVGHGATNAMLLTELYGRDPADVRDLRIDNGDVFRVELVERRMVAAERLAAAQATAEPPSR